MAGQLLKAKATSPLTSTGASRSRVGAAARSRSTKICRWRPCRTSSHSCRVNEIRGAIALRALAARAEPVVFDVSCRCDRDRERRNGTASGRRPADREGRVPREAEVPRLRSTSTSGQNVNHSFCRLYTHPRRRSYADRNSPNQRGSQRVRSYSVTLTPSRAAD